MKKSVSLAMIGTLLGGALVIGVPGISPEQQAQAFAPCNNSLTCQPANVPMLVEAGVVRIGADGIVRTAVAAPKPPASTTWPAIDWLGGVIGAAGTAVTAWSLSTFWGYDGQDVTTPGEALTTEGLPEAKVETAPGTKFQNGPTGPNGGCWDGANFATFSATNFPGTTCGATLTHMFTASHGHIFSDYSVVPHATNGTVAITATMSRVGSYVQTPSYQYGYWDTNLAKGAVGSFKWYASSSIPLGTTTQTFGIAGAREVLAIKVFLGGTPAVVWSRNGAAVNGETDTQQGTMERTMDCVDPAGVVTVATNLTTGMMGNGALSLAPLKCPPGTLPQRTKTTWKPETGEPITIIPKEVTVPKPITEMQKYPNCWGGTCVVSLERADGTSCGRIGENCPDWRKDPNRSQNYVCKFGGVLVDLNMCSMYRQPEYGVLPNVGTDGEYLSPDAPVPDNVGLIPKTNTGTPVVIGGGTSEPMKNCRPESFLQLLNPFWVFQAVQCAITETFVPRQEVVQSKLNQIRTKWDTAPPGRMIAALTGLSFTPPSSSCSGITINMAFMPEEARPPAQRFFNACPGDLMEIPAALVKLLLMFGCLWAATMSIMTSVSGLANYRGGLD